MSVIRILPDRVANQIAAGEVIERPAAVIKELVENSLDAEATRIEIEFRNGGKSLMRIVDNGMGMTPDDALLALERHATSKIREAEDLTRIMSFGFRGEALPSVASVSKFTLRTRHRDAEVGTEILINGGKFVHQREYGMPVGTEIEIAHLFNSVPVRRKFLKTDNTEAAHIINLSRLFAVANPHCAFSLLEDGRTLFRSPACPGLRDRVREIFGKQVEEGLVEIDAKEKNWRLHGLIGKPGISRATRNEIITYINRRPVDARPLNFAVIDAYHAHIPKGRYPIVILFLEMDPAGVDVNVHPAKREVRFREEAKIRNFVLQSIFERLKEIGFEKATRIEGTRLPQGPSKPTPITPPQPIRPAPVAYRERSAPLRAEVTTPPSIKQSPPQPAQPHPVSDENPPVPSSKPSTPPPNELPPAAPEKSATPTPDVPTESKSDAGWHFIGFAHGDYGVFESPHGVVLLNFHTSRARIRYEQVLAELGSKTIPTQKMLFPIPLELDPVGANTVAENKEFFNRTGFELEPFGRNFYRISSIPQWIDADNAESFIRDVIDGVRERGINPRKADVARETLAKMAAKANRGGKVTLAREAENILRQLLSTNTPLTDPEGRPTLVEWSKSELDRRFGK